MAKFSPILSVSTLTCGCFDKRSSRPLLKLLIFVAFVTGVSVTCLGQYRPNVVFWSGQRECGSKKITIGDQSQFSCKAVSINGQSVWVIESSSIRLTILPARSSDLIAVRTKIENRSKEKVEFEVAKWNVAHFESEEAFRSGRPPLLNESSIEIEPIPKSGQSVSASDTLSSPKVRQIKSEANNRDLRTVNQIPQARQRSEIVPDTAHIGTSPMDLITRRKRSFFNIKPLKAKSVEPDDDVNGIVYFNRVKESAFQLAFLHVGDTTFVFELR